MHRHHGHRDHGHCESRGEKWGAGRRGRFGGFGFGGRHGGRHGGPSGGPDGMGGDDMMRARRMLVQGDLRLLALALIARSAAARLRNHQAGRGKDRGLVLAEPRHRLSDADLSRGSRLRHRRDRGLEKALHHHRRRQSLSRRQPRRHQSGARSPGGFGRTRRPLAPRLARRTRRSIAAARRSRLHAPARDCRQTDRQRRRRRIASGRDPRPRRDGIAAAQLSQTYLADAASGVCTCSGRMPTASRRAGIRRSSGNMPTSLKTSGGFSRR